MIIAQIENQIRYVTNIEGETTDVLVPIELWQQLISSINSDNVSGLAWISDYCVAVDIQGVDSKFMKIKAQQSSF